MRKFLIISILCIGYANITLAQVNISPDWTSLIERWCEDNKTDTDELFELIYQLYENPINLNDTTQINNLFILNTSQQQSIKNYILQYGPLYSIEELHLIHNFDSTIINLLRPIVITTPIQKQEKFNLNNILKNGHHNIVIGSNRTFEKSRGFKEDIYDGDPLRFYYRYYFKYQNKIQFMISGEKDPGESMFSTTQPKGFDFYGYHLMINDYGIIKRAIIGQYYLQFGQGLTLWTGFNPYNITNVYRSSQGIRPAGVFTEYGYLNGIATTISLTKHLELSTFYSNVNRDATLTKNNPDVVQSIYNSGYHRTQTELIKKKTLNEQLWGTNIQYNLSHFHVGVTFQQLIFNKEIIPKETPYNFYIFKGNQNLNIGLDASYLWKHFLLFGEISMSQNLGFAGLMGSELALNNNTRICLYYRHFSHKYQNLHATTIGQNSSPQNENGIYMSISTTLPYNIAATLSADFFKFPWLKYQIYKPSNGIEYQLQLTKKFHHNINLSTSYRYKEYEHNTKIDTLPNYIIEQIHKHRLNTYIEYTTNKWHFVSRINNTWFSSLNTYSHGILIGQDIQYNPTNINLSITARFALFNAPTNDVHLYTVENNLQYEFNMNSFMNQGIRFYLVLHYNLTRNLSLNAKYGITYYTNKHTISNGYNEILSNHLQNIKLQIRWKF